jgi:hypothetical protein
MVSERSSISQGYARGLHYVLWSLPFEEPSGPLKVNKPSPPIQSVLDSNAMQVARCKGWNDFLVRDLRTTGRAKPPLEESLHSNCEVVADKQEISNGAVEMGELGPGAQFRSRSAYLKRQLKSLVHNDDEARPF